MTIVGHGDIASKLEDRVGFIFFASGVSNSREKRESEYLREINLLSEQDESKHLVYFSSLCIFYSHTRYAKHKMDMETLVKQNFEHYTIIRLGNITWGDNPHTIINYFKNCKKQGIEPVIKDEHRYLIDEFEFKHWLNMIPEWNCEMNIPGRFTTVRQIYENA
jgi:hypothetical protein